MNNRSINGYVTMYWARRIPVLIFFTFLLSVIVYKAVYLPITFDEESAALYYPRFSFLEIVKYPGNWPSNHVLNTIAIKLSESVFGIEPWSVRLPNILAFVLLFGILYKMAVRYFNRTVFLFWLPFVVIFCNPYLLDFFGLARGYGMSNALMVASVYCLLRYASAYRWRWFFLTAVFSMLAAYANFTLLIFWVAVHILMAGISLVSFIKNKENRSEYWGAWFITVLIALAFLALCYGPLQKMQSTNQFVYWSKNGFFKDTLIDQIWRFGIYVAYFGISGVVVAYVIIGFLIVVAACVVLKAARQGLCIVKDPLVILFVLLLLVWAVNMAQTIILGTPYLNGRTALSYYVLFGLVLMFAFRDFSEWSFWARNFITPALALMFIINLSLSVRLNQVIEWAFDANTYQVLDYLDDYRKSHPDLKQIDLNTNWLFSPSFSFYITTGKAPWLKLSNMHTNIDTTSNTLFYYAQKQDTSQIKNYSPVLSFGNGDRILMIKK